MNPFPRILIALVVLLSGLALAPQSALPSQQISWQLYADAYQPPDIQIGIQNTGFTQRTILIPVGTTVRWTNNDSTAHTVTSSTSLFDSGTLDPGESFEFLFDTPGTYHYACTLHPALQGTVIVTTQVFKIYLPAVLK
jgi:plastocyanin